MAKPVLQTRQTVSAAACAESGEDDDFMETWRIGPDQAACVANKASLIFFKAEYGVIKCSRFFASPSQS